MANEKMICVVGATGRQGGAVARRLLAKGWPVRALTRSPDGPAAQALRGLGATLAEADLRSPQSLERAFHGSHGVFGVTDFWQAGHAGEIQQGRNLVDAARAAGVHHLVLSSVGGSDRTQARGIPLMDSKRQVEEYLASTELHWSVLRPVTFFENFISARYRRTIRRGRFRFAVQADRPFQMIAMEDLAVFAELAFSGAPEFAKRAVEVASDQLTMRQFAEALGRAVGRDVQYQRLGWTTLRLLAGYVELTRQNAHYKTGAALLPLFRWMQESPHHGWNADLPQLRALHPGLLRAGDWAASVDWSSQEHAALAPPVVGPR